MNVELALFVVFGAVALAGAVTMVVARNPVFSAFGLLTAMFAVAVFYVVNGAHFVAAVQVLIYAGAVMTLFLFVIMMIGVDKSEDPTERLPQQRPLALALAGALVIVVVVAGRAAWITGVGGPGPASGTIENVSDQLFGTWLLPFEATVLLLTIAAVGTVALAQFGRVPSVPAPAAPSVPAPAAPSVPAPAAPSVPAPDAPSVPAPSSPGHLPHSVGEGVGPSDEEPA